MNKLLYLALLFTISLFSYCSKPAAISENASGLDFNRDWEFVKDMDTTVTAGLFRKSGNTNLAWQQVSLPHSAHIEPLVITGDQWQGNAFYRKFFTVPANAKNKRVAIRFEAAMHEADVYLDGQFLRKHTGGYLPFEVDLTDKVEAGKEYCVLVKLNNQNSEIIPPGKPIKTLDFNYFSGLYRQAHLLLQDKLYIANPVAAGRTAGGGLLVHYENVSAASATVQVQTEVENEHASQQEARVRLTLRNSSGKQIDQVTSEPVSISSGSYGTYKQQFNLANPELWSPRDPNLYLLVAEVLRGNQVVDRQEIKIGVRTFRFTADGFYLNGEKLFIRGTNRHQEYPYIGYALSDNAQYRDAWKIKQAGFIFVRLSHYPQAPAFMRACDELGLLVMDAIPGWQYFGGKAFQENSLQDVRDLVRRDRNHPSVVLWEASLNESRMSNSYMKQAHQAVHEELPVGDVYTCGWMDAVYDVFIPARQHGKPPLYWNNYSKNKPIFIAEYGDWEYYAQNAGFNQTAYQDLQASERTSRQLREAGEKAMLQQALNYQESHNSNLKGKAAGDANWLMYDYNRGYAPDIESSGIMDIFRLPKFAFYFYQSQYGPVPDAKGFGKPMVFIANYWTPTSTPDVRVYSNCDEVELLLNGKTIARQKPDQNAISSHLKHPPFTFRLANFEPGQLKAVAYRNGTKAAETVVTTPADPERLQLSVDLSNKDLQAGENDVVFVYAAVVDKNGTVVPDATNNIRFTVEGDGELIGANPIKAEAGIASILLKAGSKTGKLKVSAIADNLKNGELTVGVK